MGCDGWDGRERRKKRAREERDRNDSLLFLIDPMNGGWWCSGGGRETKTVEVEAIDELRGPDVRVDSPGKVSSSPGVRDQWTDELG